MDSNENPTVAETYPQCAKRLANILIERNKVSLCPERKVFVVEGLAEKKEFVVRLFREGTRFISCSCGSQDQQCAHILAAMASIDYKCDSKRKPNVTRMIKRTRKKGDKRSGTKAGRPNDVKPPKKVFI
jgi:hypothetical protein